jgi:protein SCO1/2
VSSLRVAAAAAVAALALAGRPAAAMFPPNAPQAKPGLAEEPAAVAAADVVEKLGAEVPKDVGFSDSEGRRVTVGELLARGRPVVLALVYYDCPMLCGLILGGLSKSMRESGLELGRDYEALTVSFDPRESTRLAAERQRTYLSKANAAGKEAHWPFTTSEEPQVRALADAVGFRYVYDPETRQYAHAAAVIVLTPEGRVSRYLYGIDYPARDLRLAVVEAADGRVGTSFDRLLLTCYRYDPASRRYAPYVHGFIKVGGLAVFGALAVTLGVFWRREWKSSRRGGAR